MASEWHWLPRAGWKGRIQTIFLAFGETCPGNRPKATTIGTWGVFKKIFVLTCIKPLLDVEESELLVVLICSGCCWHQFLNLTLPLQTHSLCTPALAGGDFRGFRVIRGHLRTGEKTLSPGGTWREVPGPETTPRACTGSLLSSGTLSHEAWDAAEREETKTPSHSHTKSPLPGLEMGMGICCHSHCQCPGMDQHLIPYSCEGKKSRV